MLRKNSFHFSLDVACRAVKRTIVAFALCTVLGASHAAEFTRQSVFDSLESFVAAAKAFQPAAARGELSSLFAVPEMGETNHGKPISASSIQSCDVIWSDDAAALLIVLASPPTEATRSSVGVLFLLVRRDTSWRIADLLRFTATGKEAEFSAKLTAGTGSGYHLGTEGMSPVVTVKESHGGRGYAYQIYAFLHVQRIQAETPRLEMIATSSKTMQPIGGRGL